MKIKIPQYNLDGLGGEFLLTQELETKIAKFLGVKHCVMVSSGTMAVFLAIRAIGVKKVAIPPLTMIATATAVELAGCEITFVSGNKMPEGTEAYVHVSLNGRDCDIEEIMQLNPGVNIIEDACQAFGSKYKGKYLGTFGRVGCFSFSPHKILSAGNGGCVVTNEDEIATNIRRLKNFGRELGGADQHDFIGYNFKFTDIQAKFVLKQFPTLTSRIKRKKEIYKRYYKKLGDVMCSHEGTPWFVDVYVEDRDSLAKYLAEKGIGTRKMYPLITTQPPFLKNPTFGDNTLDKKYSMQGLWLPSFFKISDKQIDFIAETINEWRKINAK